MKNCCTSIIFLSVLLFKNMDAHQSNLFHITNVPSHPIDMFQYFYEDVSKFNPNMANVMIIANANKNQTVLNRTVILRGFDKNGFYFVTQRDCKKYSDFQENPNVEVVFIWIYEDSNHVHKARQVRVSGSVVELQDNEISKYYEEEVLYAKIRSKICDCGAPVVWEQLKEKHDTVLKNYLSGADSLPQTEKYTAFRIVPNSLDFYESRENFIADRVFYKKEQDTWTNEHIQA